MIMSSLITVETGRANRSSGPEFVIVGVGGHEHGCGARQLMAIRDIHILGSPVLRHRAEADVDMVDDWGAGIWSI